MLPRIIEFTLNHRLPVLLGIVAIVGAGFYAMVGMPIDAFPDVTNVQVEIVSNAPGFSPLEIERFVTQPIEMAMRGLPSVVQMRSITKYGLSVITIVFEERTDIYFARQLVFERLAEVRERLPRGASTGMGPVATAMGEIYQYTLESPAASDSASELRRLTDLRTLQDWVVAPLLKQVAGVNEVNSFGGYLKQVEVETDPGKLLKYALTVGEVFDAIGRNNQNAGGNVLVRSAEQYVVRGVGMIRSIDDIRNIVLRSTLGTPVLIGDVAEVRIGHAVRQGAAMRDGKGEAVGGIVMMLRGENGRAAVGRVKEKVEEINAGGILPPGVRIVPYYDRSDIVSQSIGTVAKALLEGSVLVLIVLYIFLRSSRGAAIVLMALPLSLLLTFVVMRIAGLGANLMSLGGLAVSIGMIIDATIIQVENVQRRLSDADGGDGTLRTVLRAVLEVRRPSIYGELIIATTFLPILSLEGLEGKMFAPLALTVATALVSSLLLSIFVIPAICAMVLKPRPERESVLLRLAKRIYTPCLEVVLRRKGMSLGAALMLFAGGVLLLGSLGTEFMPVMDEGAFDMDVQLLPGVSLPKALEINRAVEKKLMHFPELRRIIGRTGQTGIALEARGVDKTAFTGILAPRAEWKSASSREELTDRMRGALSAIPGISFSFSQPIQCRIDELVAGTRAGLVVKLFGDDTEMLRRKAEETARLLSTVRGATDIVVERSTGQPYLTVRVDRRAIARHGLQIGDVMGAMEVAVGGRPASQFYEENRFFDISVRFPEEYRNRAEVIGDMLVKTPAGYAVPLGQLAGIAPSEGPVQISRQNGRRCVGIELNVRDRDIGGFVAEARERIRAGVRYPTGYQAAWGGQFENQQRAMGRLAMIGPAAVLLILLLLFATFKSVRMALLVMTALPFALIGGVAALATAGLYLSVPASVGFVVLFGVAVLNGLVLVSCIVELRRSGISREEAVRQACDQRLRPVLMTASIAILSLIPMLFATGPGSEIQRPLAAVVIGGLATSTLSTMLLMPALYGWFEGLASRKGSRVPRD